MLNLRKIFDNLRVVFKKDGFFKVRYGYGYDKIYLDSINCFYDMSYQEVIHSDSFTRMWLGWGSLSDYEKITAPP